MAKKKIEESPTPKASARNPKKTKKAEPLKVGTLREFPMIPMRDTVLFPAGTSFFYVGRKKSVSALQQAQQTDKLMFVVGQKSMEVEGPGKDDLYQVGVVGRVVKVIHLPNATAKVFFEGTDRGQLVKVEGNKDYGAAQVKILSEPKAAASKAKEVNLYVKLIKNQLKELLKSAENPINQNLESLLELDISAAYLADVMAPSLKISVEEKQELLENQDLLINLAKIYSLLVLEDETRKVEEKVRDKIQKQVAKNQKEYYLNEQIRAIQKELGNEDAKSESQLLEKRILEAGMPKEALDVAKKEFKKLQQSSPMNSESNVIRNYLDWLLSIPWKEKTADNLDLKNAKTILDADHYGLKEVKDRILEFIAVSTRQGQLKGPIVCLVGPPGVGKTSLARSVARALGRNFVRMSLGGVRDEAEIRGHRRTYIGAMPGKIVSAMKKAKTVNPLMLLDEVDKIYASHMGDPAAALLEALDREQNSTFMDHYLEVEYDLSQVLFFCTANVLQNIPYALRDRMEVIEIAGYTESEKLKIFQKHLVAKHLAETGLEKSMVQIPEESALEMIRSFTKEGGIRELERVLSKVYRKANRELLEGAKKKQVLVDKEKLYEYLGPPKYLVGKRDQKPSVGIVNGLSWSIFGGDLLSIEVVEMPGKGRLVLTGKLGEVMKESAQAAFSYLKANAKLFGINEKKFSQMDFHVHAPQGAIPKDGPSAGVALATALISVLLNIPVKNDLAMTGEITLRGRILPIGGLKEKILAAARAKISKVFIPEENEKDLVEIKRELGEELKTLDVVLYDDLKNLVENALTEPLKKISKSGEKMVIPPDPTTKEKGMQLGPY